MFRKKLLIALVFVAAGFVLLQIPVTQLAGSKAKFTAFDAFGPLAGAFLGPIVGAASVFLMQLGNFLFHGSSWTDTGAVIRLFPMIFAAIYLGTRGRWKLVVPVAAIIAWNLNPIGRTVWFYSLFWLIPIAATLWGERWILTRALGATFTAHAVGGALWIWFFHLPAAVWIGLIPIVAVERLIFAVGMTVGYLVLSHVKELRRLPARRELPARPA